MQGLMRRRNKHDDYNSNTGNRDENSASTSDSHGSEEDTVHRDEGESNCDSNSSDTDDTEEVYNNAIIHVKLHHSLDYPLGLNIEGGCNTPLKYIHIKSLSPYSAAHNCGKLKEGDQLVMVGDECLIGLTSKKANLVLRQAPPTVEVIAQRKAKENIIYSTCTAAYDRKESMSGMILVLKFKCCSGETLGIKTIGGKDNPYLKNIHVC